LLLAGPWSWNYHHWLLEDVSRLWAQEAFPVLAELPIVVPAMLAPFHEESLAAFGIDPARLVHFDGGRWEFRRLLVPSFLAPGGHSRRQTAWLRAHLVAGLGIDAAASGERRLYVTRRGARARVLTNEDEVAAFLVAKGFDTVDPGALGLGEQAALFAGARVIAGASGAGLTNMLFAPPGSALIEFQPDSFVNPAHWYVTNALDQSYGFVIGKSETERHDFRISTAKLAAVLDAVPSDEFHAAPSITARSASTSARK
jgi:capsular polysaccharide biosynthesis protein